MSKPTIVQEYSAFEDGAHKSTQIGSGFWLYKDTYVQTPSFRESSERRASLTNNNDFMVQPASPTSSAELDFNLDEQLNQPANKNSVYIRTATNTTFTTSKKKIEVPVDTSCLDDKFFGGPGAKPHKCFTTYEIEVSKQLPSYQSAPAQCGSNERRPSPVYRTIARPTEYQAGGSGNYYYATPTQVTFNPPVQPAPPPPNYQPYQVPAARPKPPTPPSGPSIARQVLSNHAPGFQSYVAPPPRPVYSSSQPTAQPVVNKAPPVYKPTTSPSVYQAPYSAPISYSASQYAPSQPVYMPPVYQAYPSQYCAPAWPSQGYADSCMPCVGPGPAAYPALNRRRPLTSLRCRLQIWCAYRRLRRESRRYYRRAGANVAAPGGFIC